MLRGNRQVTSELRTSEYQGQGRRPAEKGLQLQGHLRTYDPGTSACQREPAVWCGYGCGFCSACHRSCTHGGDIDERAADECAADERSAGVRNPYEPGGVYRKCIRSAGSVRCRPHGKEGCACEREIRCRKGRKGWISENYGREAADRWYQSACRGRYRSGRGPGNQGQEAVLILLRILGKCRNGVRSRNGYDLCTVDYFHGKQHQGGRHIRDEDGGCNRDGNGSRDRGPG